MDTSADAPGQRQSREQRVSQIVEAAAGLFAERGFSGTSSRALAEACRLNVATIAHHVGGKADLYAQVFQWAQDTELTEMAPYVVTALERVAADPDAVVGAILDVVDGYLAFLDRRPEIAMLWLRRILDRDPRGEQNKPPNPNSGLYALVREQVEVAVRRGTARPVDLELMLRGFVWMAYARLKDDPLTGDNDTARFREFVHDYVRRLLDPHS
jgi:AcrR family transcriptional regulator